MKKIISMLMVMIMAITPLFSSNCFAADKSNTTSSQSTFSKYSKVIVNGAKKTAVLGLIVLFGAMAIKKFDLAQPVGKGFRFFCDYLKDSIIAFPSVVKNLYNSFSKPSEIAIFDDVNCPNVTSSWFSSKGSKCLSSIIKELQAVYNENIDLFSDPNSKYSLVFKRV